MTLRELLTRHDLSAYVAAFEAQHVPVSDLPHLSDEDLRVDFGVTSYVDRKRFRAMVASLSGAPGTPPPDSGATRMAPPPADPGATRMDASSSWPAQIGNYRILGVVGAGGMGTVLRARHTVEAWAEKQGGDVAIKLIHPHLASDPAFQLRFIDEAGLGKDVRHAGLVPVHEVVSDGAWLGSVMGLVSGEPLSSRVTGGGLSVEEVIRLLAPVGEALDFLHAQGIVHRDVKPANIVVRADGRPMLLDLGIAKDTRGGGESHTRTMTAMGTSAWMAPEQADAKHVDGAADRYAFGLMVYALLAGRMPWGADTSELGVVVKKATGQLEALGGVPAHVGAAVMRMLSVSAGERYSSCAAFVDALRRDGEGEKRAAREKAEREAREKAEREAKERAEREAAGRAARAAQVRAAQERAERAAREAREKAEREAKERAAQEKAARDAAENVARLFAPRRVPADRVPAGGEHPTFVFPLPEIGEGVVEGEIVRWLVKPGEDVVTDQPLCEIITDKATVEISSPKSGRVARTHGNPGDVIKVHAPLVEIDLGGAGAAASARAERAAREQAERQAKERAAREAE
jgi:pyruvate/2-oxoglutarate dehydrogenase complex dihydrolipoamide acyltransferase (E2) component